MRDCNYRHRKVLTACAVLTAGALALTACGGGDDSDAGGGGGDPTADGPVDLRMTVWSANEGHHAIFNEIAEGYIAEHPDQVSSVSFEALDFGNYLDALTTQIAGGEIPDMAWLMESYATEFVELGVFDELTSTFSETEGYAYDDLLPGAIELWSIDDTLYGYPFSNSPFGIYVNSDLLEAADQPNPRELIAEGSWTWDALMEIATATVDSQDVAGFQPASDPYTQWNDALGPMWLSWGASAWSEDGTACTMTDPEMVEFFDWFHGHVFDTGAIPGPGEENNFPSGQIAFRMSQLSASTGLAEAPFAWDFVPLPEGPAGAVPVVGQGGVGVLAQGENPEIAADFLAYFTSPESSELMAEYFPPPRQSLLNVETLQEAAPVLSAEQLQGTVIDQALVAVTKQGNPHMSELSDPVRIALDEFWTADGDAATVLTSACAAMDPLLTEG